ncbi:unnamed protein product [Cuscuta campestris]|uniref:J domain-containing protein n=1 Tax=Cuscuta campestris TaxID=132261 RepID=A0A484KTS4_9ASTE|nr:unnamed protein product [Cuscuta campestris]
MASTASFPLSSQFLGAVIPPPQQRRVSFRRPVSVSASCSTAERTANVASTRSLYDVLGIRTEATGQEIKAAYRRLARVLHPDVAPGSMSEDFIRVHAAYSTLSDPDKRASYDRSLFRSRLSAAAAVATDGGYSVFRSTHRKWETDQCW